MEVLLLPMSPQSNSPTRFKTISPVDGSVYLERAFADQATLEETLALAAKAQQDWRGTSLTRRADYCKKAVNFLVERAGQIGMELSWQMGRPICYTPMEIRNGLKERADHMIKIADAALAKVGTSRKDGFERYILHEPLGTVLVLAPWNYPFLTSVNAIIPALMSGNTVILKHATQTALVAERYQEAFQHAELPPGVFQYLHLNHQQVAQTIKDHRINYVAFTGSESGGRAVQTALAHRFINAGLELGGKDPAFVRSDAHLSHAIESIVDGAYFNSGQSCCGIERIYVQQDVYQDFVEGFVEKVKEYQIGNPLDQSTTLGPMVRPDAKKYIQAQIQAALDAGAQTLIDDRHFPSFDDDSAYLAPQVLINVDHRMDVMQQESFGPVVGIMPVRSDQEAIELMNDSPYGLTASIWTSNSTAAKQIGLQLDTGTVFMNRCDYLDPELAWTGVKNSGRGCSLSSLGYQALTRPKSFHLRNRIS